MQRQELLNRVNRDDQIRRSSIERKREEQEVKVSNLMQMKQRSVEERKRELDKQRQVKAKTAKYITKTQEQQREQLRKRLEQ